MKSVLFNKNSFVTGPMSARVNSANNLENIKKAIETLSCKDLELYTRKMVGRLEFTDLTQDDNPIK
jgi:hypothetical protein